MKSSLKLFILLAIIAQISLCLTTECVKSIPIQASCSDQKICKGCKNNNCKNCKFDDLYQCTDCFYNYKLSDTNDCVKMQPDDPSFYCIQLSDDKQNCIKCDQDYYLLNNLETSKQNCRKLPVDQKSVCRQNTSLNKQIECISCQQNQNVDSCGQCKSHILQFNKLCSDLDDYSDYCTSEKCQRCNKCDKCQEDDCSCETGYVRKEGVCQINVAVYESTFSKNTIKTVTKQTETTSQVITQSSVVLSQAQNAVTYSSFALLITGLTNQKVVYLVLVQANLPAQIYTALMASLDQIPSQQMQFLNFLTEIFESDNYKYSEFPDLKFTSVKLQYSIFYNCGQGISLFFICTFLFGIFYILTEKVTHQKAASLSKTLYNKLFSGFIIQYFQLIVSMFAIGVNAQLLEFAEGNEIQHIEAKIVITIIFFAIIFIIFYKLYYYLNFQTTKSVELNFSEITREKIQNETIFESKYRKNYMLIHLAIESILFPTIFIQLHSSYVATSVLSLIFQISLLGITLYLMPFYSKLTNCYFILNQLLWVIFLIQYLIILVYCSKENINDYASTLDNISWSFIITLQIILLSNPLYMIISLIMQISQLIKSKKKDENNKSECQIELINNSQKSRERSINQFPAKLDTIQFKDTIQSNISIYTKQFQKLRSSYRGSRISVIGIRNHEKSM